MSNGAPPQDADGEPDPSESGDEPAGPQREQALSDPAQQAKVTPDGQPTGALPGAPAPPHGDGHVVEVEQTTTYAFVGPLPDPGTLRGYAQAIPGLDRTIIAQWKKQTDHRIEMERRTVALQEEVIAATRLDHSEGYRLARRGQWFALAAAGLVVGAGVFAIAMGQAAVGASIIGVGVAGVVTAFLGQKKLGGSGPPTPG